MLIIKISIIIQVKSFCVKNDINYKKRDAKISNLEESWNKK